MRPLMLAIIVVIIGLMIVYLLLVKKKNKVLAAASELDARLSERGGLIAGLLTACGSFPAQAGSLAEDISQILVETKKLTFSDAPAKKNKLENRLSQKLSELLSAAAKNPTLKSEALQETLKNLDLAEEQTAAAQDSYNALVKDLRNTVEIFPGNVMARLANIRPDWPLFEKAENAKRVKAQPAD